MALQYENNAQSTLQSALAVGATTLNVATGEGSLFPALGVGDFFPLTIIRADGSDYEIVRATARAGDVIEVVRATENTTDIAFAAGDILSTRITKAFLDEFAISGSENLSILRGINFSKGLGVVGSNLYNVTVQSIGSYTDDLAISFLPHSPNTTATSTRINLNNLGAIDIVLPNGDALHAGAIGSNRRAEIHYDASLGQFVLDNAVPPALVLPTASDTVAGIALRGTDEDFDVDGDNTAYTTQRTVSRIVADHVADQIGSIFDTTWRNYGRGIGGNFTISGATSRASGRGEEFETFTVDSGAILTLTGGHTTVIRATQAIVIEGQIVINDHESTSPETFVGGRGTITGDASASPGSEPNIAGVQRAFTGPQALGGRLDFANFEAAVMHVPSLQHFHGGHGRGNVNPGAADFRTPGCAGLILIAPSVTIGSTATIDARSRRGVNGAGHGAGGTLIVATPSFTLDPAADFIAGDGSTTDTAVFWDNSANYNENAGAANAQLYHINTGSGIIDAIF